MQPLLRPDAPFPLAASDLPPPSEALRRAGLTLRPALAADLPFLRDLYRSFRAEELALVPWTAAQKAQFLDDQFRLQHADWTVRYAGADFLVVDRPVARLPLGRLYLDRRGPVWRIIDIGLAPQSRSRGLGRILIEWICSSAADAGAQGVGLAVLATNPRAEALYRRLGFKGAANPGDMRRELVWTPVA